MENTELGKMINEFFDGELDECKETALFQSLAENSSAREYFRNFNQLKNLHRDTDFLSANNDLDKKITGKIFQIQNREKSKIRKMKFFLKVSSIAASIFLFVGVYYIIQNNKTEASFDLVCTQQFNKIDKLNELINIQNNSEVLTIKLSVDELKK